MTTTVLDVLASHRAGYWGVEAGGAEVDVRAIRNGDVGTTGTLRWDELPSRGFTAAERDRAQVRLGDLVITSSGNCGEVAIIDREPAEPTCVTNFVRRLRPNRDVVDSRYIFHFMRRDSFRTALAPFVRGTTLKNLSVESALGHVPIPLPSLEEQRRVAAILDQADALRAKRLQAVAAIDGLPEAFFADMFGSGAGIPRVALGRVARVSGGKRLPKGSDYAAVPTAHPYIRVTDMKNASIDEGSLQYLTSEVQARIARYIVMPGDVVISIAGSIGIVAAVPDSLGGANLTENAAKIRALDADTWDPAYMAAVLRTRDLQSQIAGRTGRVTIGKLALFRIEQLEVPLPPVTLQRIFRERVAAAKAHRAGCETQLAQMDALFASLQERAFKGEL